MTPTLYLLISFLIAGIPTGYILTSVITGADLRQAGSGNIGTTNVMRVAGRGLAAITLTGDLLKGLLPVLLAPWALSAPWFASLVALVVFAAHCWTPYLDFRGGKGVATAAGALLALAPLATLGAALAWLIVVLAWKKSSLGALVAVVLVQVLVAILTPGALWTALLLGGGVVWRHRPNIERLLRGVER